MTRLQVCEACGAAQYPPREACGACLSERLGWLSADGLGATLLARTTLHHSNEPGFRGLLPLSLGLVRFALGPVAVCFVRHPAEPGDALRVRCREDGLLEATPGEPP